MKNKFRLIPKALRRHLQFVCWKYHPDPKNPKKGKKVPFDPKTGEKASVTARATWGTYDQAISCYEHGGYDGIGFVFTSEDPFVGIDLDSCRNKKTGEIASWAQDIINEFDSYTEVSPTGTGVHIIAKGKLSKGGRRQGNIEIYDDGRYFTLTGNRINATPMPIKGKKNELKLLYEGLHKAKKGEAPIRVASKTGHRTDQEVIAELSRSVAGVKFSKLLSGDYSGYNSRSEAELAFCSLLTKVTDSPDTIDRIFRNSKLMRPKWDELRRDKTYGSLTIANALKSPNSGLPTTSKEESQYDIALKVIEKINRRNINAIGNQLWKWEQEKGLWRKADDQEIKKLVHEVAHHDTLTKNQVDSIIGLLKTQVYLHENPFNKNTKRVINCQNGELHYKKGEWTLEPHNRRNYFSQQIPVAYDAKAPRERFTKFLDEIFAPDSDKKEKVKLLQEFIGYSLTRSCEFERFLILVGQGANGKSVILSLIKALLGAENVAGVQPNQLENRFQLAHLQGKLANIITEIPEGAVVADAKLKALVSGELMTAEHKYAKPFDFEPYATMFFATNHLPHTKDFSSAFFRRAEILTFNRTFSGSDSDKMLKHKLQEELSGILNFALEGLKRLYKRGDFSHVESSARAKKHWERASDQVAAFVDEECELSPGAKAKTDDLYRKYMEWVEESGMKSSLNKINFSSRIVRLGCEHTRGAKGIRMIVGIRLRLS